MEDQRNLAARERPPIGAQTGTWPFETIDQRARVDRPVVEGDLPAPRDQFDLGSRLPEQRSHFNLSAAYEFVEGRALEAGAEDLIAHVRESDDFQVLQLRRRGYSGKRIFPWWELDLAQERERLLSIAAGSDVKMRDAGVELLTLAGVGGLEAVLEELVELQREASLDTPRDEPRVRVDADGRTREPSPLVAFADGRLFLSVNPTLGKGRSGTGETPR